MALKARELREALKDVADDSDVYVALDGHIVTIDGITNIAALSLAIIRGKGQPREGKRFTTSEDGLIGGLQRMGASNEAIGEVLGRPESSIKQRRKQLGF